MKLAALFLVITLSSCASIPPKETAPPPGPKPSDAEASRLSLQYLKPRLKDPDSIKHFELLTVTENAYFLGIQSGSQWANGWRVCFSYNAKNSYGAYAGTAKATFVARCDTPDACRYHSQGGGFETATLCSFK